MATKVETKCDCCGKLMDSKNCRNFRKVCIYGYFDAPDMKNTNGNKFLSCEQIMCEDCFQKCEERNGVF